MTKGFNQDPVSDGLVTRKNLGLYFFHLPTGVEVVFKAFLTAYEDSFESKWSSERVYGRNDPIHTFQGTERSISLAWDVPSVNLAEGQRNFSAASDLYKMLYPTYSRGPGNDEVGIIAGAPLIKLKFGNLIMDTTNVATKSTASSAADAKSAGLLGYIDGLKFAPDLESGFFDHAAGQLIPQTIKLSCNFHVLHAHPLGWNKDEKKWRNSGKSFPYNSGVTTAPTAGDSTKGKELDHTPAEPDSSEAPLSPVEPETPAVDPEFVGPPNPEQETAAAEVLGSGGN